MDSTGNIPLNLAMEKLGLGTAFRNKKLAEMAAERKAKLAQEEAILESIIVDKICSKDWDSLLPNSGKSTKIGTHNICVRYRKDDVLRQRIWEWHGHVMIYDEYDGYSPDYVYGNYFEPLVSDEEVKLEMGVGLGTMISGVESIGIVREF
ncbi:hypothetical protein O6H91_15G015300 [Diphasiastrum complanatum]|nr:hypothetical protein O6H91_15G015300 [Diphasiastrum complanatum]